MKDCRAKIILMPKWKFDKQTKWKFEYEHSPYTVTSFTAFEIDTGQHKAQIT